MPISKDQARNIAKEFLELSHSLGSYRFDNWDKLSLSQRRQIEDAEWDLLNYSNRFVTTAVGITLADMQNDLMDITNATAKAQDAVATIETVKDVIKVAAALVVLGGAIASQSPSAIASAAGDVIKVANNAINKKKV